MAWGKPTTVDLLKEQCNRYVNGQCQTRRCLVRGGYEGAGSVDYEVATCEYHEAVQAVEKLVALETPLRSWLEMQSGEHSHSLYSAGLKHFTITPVIPD